MSTPVRVLAFMDTYIVSGPGKQLATIVPELAKHNIHVEVVCFSHRDDMRSPYAIHLERAGVKFHILATDGRINVALFRRFQQLIDQVRPDVIQSHSFRPAFLALAAKLSGLSQPWVAFFHGHTMESARVRLYNVIDQIVLRFARRLVVVSELQKRRFPLLRHIRQINNAVVDRPGSSATNDDSPTLASARPRIGLFGRLSHEKGWDVFLQAVALLAAQNIAFTIVVAGDGPDREQFETLARELGLTDRITMLGLLPSVASLYPQIDVLALTSRSEGMPNVVLEALAHDVPVVATSVGAIPEILADPDAGEIVASGDIAGVARALKDALARGKTPNGSAARAKACTRYSLDSRVAAHVELYREVFDQRRPRE